MKNTKETGRYSFLLDLLMSQQFTHPNQAVISSKANDEVMMEFAQLSPPSKDKTKTPSVSIYDFPDYLELEILRNNQSQRIYRAPLYKGFSIDLTTFKGFEDYLRQRLTSKKRSGLKGALRRFEHCIQPEYKVYQSGDISEQECKSLLLRLEHLIEERFHLKREANYELPLMHFYQKVFYQLMLDKKASIYVIYDRGRAISISMNLILGNTLMLFNSSYDNHYSPFGLGHINMMKNIEWAFENNFKTIDLGRGDYTHKRRWVNKSFTYMELKFGFDGFLLKTLKALIGIILLRIRYLLIQILKFFGFQHLYAFIRKLAYSFGSSQGNGASGTYNKTELLPVKDVDRSNLVPVDLFGSVYSKELAAYLAVLYNLKLSHNELKPYLLENKPACLYVEKGGLLFRLGRVGEKEQ